MAEKIVLGSGKLYVAAYAETIPADSVLEVDGNLLGLIQGGASVEYTPTFYEAKDDFGLVSKKILTDEVAMLKSGIMTWNAQTLKKLISTGTLTSTSTEHKLEIGGVDNYTDTKYIVHFVHKDAVDGDIRVTMIASNEGGLMLSFAKDKETVINAEFKARPADDEGTLIIYREEISGTKVTGVSLNKSEVELEIGLTEQLTATVSPSTAVDKTYAYSTSNEAVATVSEEGLVTATGVGEAVITVTTTDGSKTATCNVTVISGD